MTAYGFRHLTLCLGILFLTSFSVQAGEFSLTILHTNDHHGHFQKFAPYPQKDVGGLAAQSTLVNIVRAEVEAGGGQVLLLSAGDVNTGVPESDLLDAEPDFTMMNMIGYDAMTLGNHEFDNPLEVLMKQQQWAEFPFLAANVIVEESGLPLVEPYIIKDLGDIRVGIIGLITDEVPTLVLAENIQGLKFLNPIESARQYLPEIQEKADIVIALTHIGFYGDDSSKIGDVQLAMALPEIDVIVGGHTHTSLQEPYMAGNTLIVQADGYSEHVGRLDLAIDVESGTIGNSSFELIPVNGKKRIKYKDKSYYQYVGTGFVEDKALLKAAEPFLAIADKKLQEPVGTALVELEGGKSLSRSRETNLGNLITDGMRAKTGADIALQNGGGIRAGIAPGVITYRDILTVQPFGNTLTEMKLTGSQILELLNLAATKVGSGGFLQVSGLKLTYNSLTGKAEEVLFNNSPLELNGSYSVVTNNFVASGGDGYAMLKDIEKYDTGYVDAEATMDYIKSLKEVSPQDEGRITVLE